MRTTVIPKSAGEVAKKMLKFGEGNQISVEEAKAQMIAAAEPATTFRNGTRVPSHIQNAAPANARPAARAVVQEPVEEFIEDPSSDALPAYEAPQPARPAQPARVAAQPSAPTRTNPTRIEKSDFVMLQYKDGNQWVAEIQYHERPDGTTPGTERFTASSLPQLNLKLLEGKAHGTIRVQQATRREKEGFKPETWTFFYSAIQKDQGISQAEFLALPAASQNAIYDAYQTVHISEWLSKHAADYTKAPENWTAITGWLKKQNIPLTERNLEFAFRDLKADGKLTLRPQAPVAAAPVQQAPPSDDVPTDAPVLATPRPVATAPAVRKRGATGLIPGQSSASPSGVDSREPAEREITPQQARQMPINDLRRLAIPSLEGKR
jgi:hypothetical protein